MSKLDEMIRELCPDGVQVFRLEEIAHYAKTRIDCKTINEDNYVGVENLLQNKAGKTKATSVPTTGMVIAYQKNDILIGNIRPYLRKVWLADCEGGTNGDVLTVQIEDTEKVLPQFLYYVLSSEKFFLYDIQNSKGAKMPRGSKDAVMKFEVPLPHLDVQREIVRMLDSYTESVVELQRQLTAELTARKTQYSHYRDKMLTPKDDVVVETLGNICRFVRGPFGGALKKEIFKPTGYAVYEQQHAIYRKLEFRYYIDKQKYEELKRFAVHPGEMIVSCSGTIGKTFVIPENAPEGVINQALLKLTPTSRINVFYLQYFFDNTISKILNSVARGGAIKNVPSVEELKAIKIPIPTLEVQQRLVEVLDNFEKICSDLNIGLPAEIEARQKQYEYYRDKLLTFVETGNTILSRAEQSRALIKLVQYVYGCVWLELGDVIVSLNTGLNPRKFFKLNTEDATNYYITIREMKDGKIVPSEKTDRMNDEAQKLCNNRSNLEVGDVLFSGTGTIGETAVIEKEPSNWNIKEGVYAIKPNQTMIKPMYLRYILMTDFIKKEYMKKAAGGTVQSVPMGELKKIRIPVPSLQEQNRIVGVLKQLDDLCNDLTSGLPAEIEARQKQYEYYRDKLLSFKEHKNELSD